MEKNQHPPNNINLLPSLGLLVNLVCDIHWLLCLVWVVGALVCLEVQVEAVAQAALGQHAVHCLFNNSLWQTLY